MSDGNTRSKRKPNFTETENIFLVEEYEKYKDILQQKLNNTEINRQKMAVWRKVCEELNIRNRSVHRTPDEVRRKWKNMITTARREKLQLNPAKVPSMISQRLLQGCEKPEERSEESAEETESRPTAEDIKVEPLSLEGVTKQAALTNMLPQKKNSVNTLGQTPLNSLEVVQPVTSSENSFAGLSEGACSRSQAEEVDAAMGSGMEVVQPGPPASLAASGATHRKSIRVAMRPKRQRIHSLLHNAKKRRLETTHPPSPTFGFDLAQLQKEKLMLEKEKLVLEKEKLILEKEKLALEIQCLRSQLHNDTVSDSEVEN